MKRIAVFSDTHGRLDRLPFALERMGTVDAFIHLGDFAHDAERIAELLPVPYHAVSGNCDCYRGTDGNAFPREEIVTIEKASLLCVHGDAFRDTYSLSLKAEEAHCAAVLYGHTHIPDLSASGAVLIVNPGSLSLPRGGSRASFAILTVDGKDVNVRHCPL